MIYSQLNDGIRYNIFQKLSSCLIKEYKNNKMYSFDYQMTWLDFGGRQNKILKHWHFGCES